jgi:hypothetical protein
MAHAPEKRLVTLLPSSRKDRVRLAEIRCSWVGAVSEGLT